MGELTKVNQTNKKKLLAIASAEILEALYGDCGVGVFRQGTLAEP